MMRELVLELASCAREVGAAPHFLGVATWIHEHLQHDREGDSQPKLMLPPAIDQLREVAKHRALTVKAPLPERRPLNGDASLNGDAPLSGDTPLSSDVPFDADDKTRDARIEAKLDDLHGLLDHDTLFDSSAHLSWLEGDASEGPSHAQPSHAQPSHDQDRARWEAESSAPSLSEVTRSALSLQGLDMPPSQGEAQGSTITGSHDPFLATEEDVEYTSVIDRKRFQRTLQEGDDPLKGVSLGGRARRVWRALTNLEPALVFKVLVLLLLAIIATLAYLLGTSR